MRLLGYAITCVAFWAVLALHIPSAVTFVLAWALVSAATWSAFAPSALRRGKPLVELPAWSPPEARTLVLLLLLVPAVFVLPYKNLGARDAEGNRFYRAYFTADFIWHMALTAELTKYAMPPVNPYLGDRTIQYYWTYFLVPAVISEEGIGGLREIENSLKVNALCSGVLFIAALVIATWAASLSAAGTAFAVVLAVVAASAEGLYACGSCVREAEPLAGADRPEHRRHEQLAIQRPAHRQPREIDVVQPAAFHVGSARIAGDADRRRRRRQRAHRGDRSGGPRTGIVDDVQSVHRRVVFAHLRRGGCSQTRCARASSSRCCITRLQPRSSVLPSAGVSPTTWSRALLAWCCTASAAYARNTPVATLMMSLGPLIVPAMLGMWPPWRLPRRAWPAVAGTVLGLLVFYLVRLSVEGSYIGFRAGQLMQLALPGLAALFFARLWSLDALGAG